MREIKFRAWDTIIKKMDSAILVFPDDISKWNFDNETVWMQYTGLKDKNGVEIYEGDILKNIEDKWIDYIVFQGAAFEFSDGSSYWDKINDLIGLDDFEVIGNIYENLELLSK